MRENEVTRAAFVQAGSSLGIAKPGQILSLFMRWWDMEFPDDRCPHQGPVPLESLRLFFERAESVGPENTKTSDGNRLADYASGRHEQLGRILRHLGAL